MVNADDAGVVNADDSMEEHAYDAIFQRDWLCDQGSIEAFVRQAPLELMRL